MSHVETGKKPKQGWFESHFTSVKNLMHRRPVHATHLPAVECWSTVVLLIVVLTTRSPPISRLIVLRITKIRVLEVIVAKCKELVDRRSTTLRFLGVTQPRRSDAR